jgi:hypothetical protein
MGKKGKADLNNMSVFTLSRAILSMRMWAGHKMSNAHMFKKGTKVVIPPPLSWSAWPTISDRRVVQHELGSPEIFEKL